MMKTFLCIAILLSVAQASSVLEALKRLLEEEENLETRGVFKMTNTGTSLRGTVMVDINDCPRPADGCKYTLKVKNMEPPYDEKTSTVYTGPTPVQFEFSGLNPAGTYQVTGCMDDQNGLGRCGPKKAVCKMSERKCAYAPAKKDLDIETRGVMQLTVGSNSIDGKIQVDTRDCPKPFNCDYTVKCTNQATGQGYVRTYDVSSTSSFSCKNLAPGTYVVAACKNGNGQCGPRVATCTVPNGSCSMKVSNNI